MMQPLVTVVVPVYNVEPYLERCLNSIVSQTYKHLEIILIDDGSPDNCPAICDSWSQKDVRISVVHKQNAGLGMARNTGIEKATGKYIFFFDSDDYVDSQIVEKCVNNAEQFNSDAVIYGRYDAYDDGRIEPKRVHVKDTFFSGDAVKSTLLPAMFTYDMGFGVSACGKMFNLETIKRMQLRFLSEREVISEDSYFALEFFSCATVVTIIDENLYYYYKRATSLSRAFRKDRQQKNNVFITKSIDFIRQQHLPRRVETHIMAKYHTFSLSAMKQVYESTLTQSEKSIELKRIFNDKVLRASLKAEVLSLHKRSLQLFFWLLKLRCIPLCKAMLRLRQHRA